MTQQKMSQQSGLVLTGLEVNMFSILKTQLREVV